MKNEIYQILQKVQNGEQSIGEAQAELLFIFNIVRGGDFENEIVPGEEVLFETTTATGTPNTPTKPLPAEGEEKSVSVGFRTCIYGYPIKCKCKDGCTYMTMTCA